MTEREQPNADFIAAVKPVCNEMRRDKFQREARLALPEALERLAETVKRIENLERRLTIMDDMRGEAVTARDRQHDRANAAEAKRDELQKLRQIAQNWQENERAIVEHGPSEGRGRWKMETELALSLALDRLAAQEEKP